MVEYKKTCTKCRRAPPASHFYPADASSDALRSECRKCCNKASVDYGKNVGNSILSRANSYNMAVSDVRKYLRVQACQACGLNLPDSRSKKFDHCHTHGHFRGVLCHRCNLACSGTSWQAIQRLRACIAYLERDMNRNPTSESQAESEEGELINPSGGRWVRRESKHKQAVPALRQDQARQ